MESVICEDAYLSTQMSVFRRIIRPTDVWLKFGQESTLATMLQVCRELVVVVWKATHML